MNVSILDRLDRTPSVGDRFLLNPPTQGITNTEKGIIYNRRSNEIRKTEAVFGWFTSILLHKDTCIRVSLLLGKDFCIFHTTKLGGYF